MTGRLAASCGLALVGVVAGCRSLALLPEVASPRQAYLRQLQEAGLTARELGAAWIAVAREAVADPTAIPASYRETGFFDPGRPGAAAFALDLRRGEEVAARLTTAPLDLPVFLELVRPTAEGWEVVAAAPEGRALRHAPRADERLVLLLQPELLAGGRYTLEVVVSGSLLFPVAGPEPRRILSVFGAARAGGARRHEGVDIAAPRGTPALAADDGWIVSAGENALGGRVVWMRADSGVTLYYAHLDRRLVRAGARVRRGEAIGEVGDTGNARGTTPHLHFEVNAAGTRLDPEPWVRPPVEPAPVTADPALLGAWSRATREGARVRGGPGTDFPIATELVFGQAARVEAAARDWYRLALPDGRRGYVAAFLVTAAVTPLRQLPLHAPLELRAAPARSAPPIARLEPGQRAAILALSGETILVQGPGGAWGWTELP